MALFHLIFILIKIGILGSLYAAIVFVVTRYTFTIFNKRLPIDASRFWWLTQIIISLSLFFYSFTYWGDHGIGDTAVIPIGHGQQVRNSDGGFIYFLADDNQHEIVRFELTDDQMFGEQHGGRYLIFDLKTSKVQEFKSRSEYEDYVGSRRLPAGDKFKDFNTHYKAYWSGWRFWLLA